MAPRPRQIPPRRVLDREKRSWEVLLLALLVLVLGRPPLAAAQDEEDEEEEVSSVIRVTGRVSDLPGEPIAGASVSLARKGATGAPRWHDTTNRKGRWGILGPAPGRWRIVVEAAGYYPADGWVDVPEDGAPAPVEIWLRSLDEVTPSFSEDPGTLRRWLEAGNALLAQGRTAAARAEYEKALTLLPPAERPDVLQAVARTHFLEGDVEATVTRLEEALRLAPDHEANRKLYRALAEEIGRSAAAEAFLASLAEAPRAAPAPLATLPAPEERIPPEVARWLDAEPVPLTADLRGTRTVRLADPSPLGNFEVFLERSGWTEQQVREYDDDPGRDLSEESFHLVVPEGEAPEAGWGVIVWVSPWVWGGFSREEIGTVLARRGIVWIGANHAGNPRPVWERWALALDAAASVSKHLPVDPSRVWVAGYSGGGRVASALATLYPEVFAGSFSFFGVDHFHPVPVPDKPGIYWPVGFAEPPKERLATARDERSFVMVTGEKDFNRAETWAVFRHLVAEGFRRVEIIDLPGADHYSGIPAEALERGLAWLDRP